MSDSTRRRFLAAAGIGTAGGVAAMAVPNSAGATTPQHHTTDVSMPHDAPATMAAYIHDVHKGEVALMVEGHQVIVTDHALTAQLARAFANANHA